MADGIRWPRAGPLSITVDDLDAAVRFYDAVLGELGHERVSLTDTTAGYGTRNSPADDGHCYLSIVLGADPVADDRHWAFRADSRADVVRFHARAMVHGGSDDGGESAESLSSAWAPKPAAVRRHPRHPLPRRAVSRRWSPPPS